MDREYIFHTIQLGQHLGDILAIYRIDRETLLSLNPELQSDQGFQSDLSMGASSYSEGRSLRVPRPIEWVVPEAYVIATEDDLLRRMWEKQWGRNAADYDAHQAEELFKRDLLQFLSSLQVVHDPTLAETQANLEQLTLEQLIELYDQHPREDRPYLSTMFGSAAYDEYVRFYQDIQVLEQGDELFYDRYADFEADLALTDYFQQEFGTQNEDEITSQIFGLAVDMFVRRVVDLSLLGLSEDANLSQIEQALREQGISENATIEALIGFLDELAEENFAEENSELSSRDLGDAILFNDEALDIAVGYHDALALDQLRQIVYDPNWNPVEETRLLQELLNAIVAMPSEIFGVDVSFAKDGLAAYHEQMVQFNNWRLALKPHIDRIEVMMLERRGEEQPSFWWLIEIPLGILLEPLDWYFTIRDLLQGDWGALLGFLPLVPSALRHIADAGRYNQIIPSNLRQRVQAISSRIPIPASPNYMEFRNFAEEELQWMRNSDGSAIILEEGRYVPTWFAARMGWMRNLEAFENSLRTLPFGTQINFRGEMWNAPVEMAAAYRPVIENGVVHYELVRTWQGNTSVIYVQAIGKNVYQFDAAVGLVGLQAGSVPMPGLVFTHYHPNDLSFSLADVIDAIRGRASELRAVTQKGAFQLLLPTIEQSKIHALADEITGAFYGSRIDPDDLLGENVWKEIFSGNYGDINWAAYGLTADSFSYFPR